MTLIKNATIVNEGRIFVGSLLIEGETIARIMEGSLPSDINADHVIDATGMILMPGVIDTHVHFRDAGEADMAAADFGTESRAAVAGGVTSVVDMPNTVPQTTTLELMEKKEKHAAEVSMVNYGFMLGATNDNIDTILSIDPKRYAAIKLFLGSSTGNMLVNDNDQLDHLFKEARKLIVAHCESEDVIKQNTWQYKLQYEQGELNGLDNLAEIHPKIRNTQACYLSTYHAIERALKYNTRLHVAHLTTATELSLFGPQKLDEKHITAEVTPNHLWFDDRDYKALGNLIKCNPAIKSNDDRLALWAALYDNLIDTIGSDHAPHPLANKEKNYFDAPGGIPSIQHELPMMLETFFNPSAREQEKADGETGDKPSILNSQLAEEWLPIIVEKMSHNPAKLFGIEKRGFIREGYQADLVLVRTGMEHRIEQQELKYKCGWSPLVGETMHTQVEMTMVNGSIAYDSKNNDSLAPKGQALTYSK